MKYYWLIMPEYYRQINRLLNAEYTDKQIKLFIENYPNGIYATYNDDDMWRYMPFPDYTDSTLKSFDSRRWLETNEYEYKGVFSRKLKLLEIKKTSDNA